MRQASINVVGAGIVGLWQSLMLLRAGHRVVLSDHNADPFANNASRLAGALIAPECEAEGSPDIVRDLGREGLKLWREFYPDTIANGTLVVALPRDGGELRRFARMTEGHEGVEAERLRELEPALSGRFDRGLFYADEAHIEAAHAMLWLLDRILALGGTLEFGAASTKAVSDIVIDCRGFGARSDLPGLRGVRGERLLIEARDVALSRPVRVLHPRQPIYVVPQSGGRYVVGATVIEREDDFPVTVKSALEILGTTYALHPAFGEAKILEMSAGIRPAFAENVPRIVLAEGGRTIRVNGVFRHGYLLAPVLANLVVDYVSAGRREGPLFCDA